MERFVIAISKETGKPGAQPRSTISVEVDGERARVTEINVRASEGGSLDSASIAVVDLLLRAFVGQAALPPAEPLVQMETPAPAEEEASAAEEASTEGNGRARRRTGARPASRPRRAARKSVSAASSARTEAASATGGGRAYRRMPAPDDMLAAYREVGSVNGLATYFDVPLHTAKGWARRMRQMGYELSR